MRPLIVVVSDPPIYPHPEFFDIVCWKEINILLLDSSPEALNPYIILATASTVHGYLDIVPFL